MPSNTAPDTKLPTLLIKKPFRDITTPQNDHPYGIRSKTKTNSIVFESSPKDEIKTNSRGLESSSVSEALEWLETYLTTSQPKFKW